VSYSPHLRTAVLLSGSGTAGAYHAGVLRALHEAGIKLDVMSGRGIGVVGALFAAIDAAPKTWEDNGLWRRRPAARLYRWRGSLRAASALLMVAAAILTIPLLVLATGLVVYPLSFLVEMISVDAGHRLATAYAELIARAFGAAALPTLIPRLVTLVLATGAIVLAATAWRSPSRGPRQAGHRTRGRWWTRLVGAPWTAEPGLQHVQGALWQVFRGPANARQPAAADLSRRYLELLSDNLGQPGFRELIVTTLDLETRTDLIFAVVGEPHRQAFFHREHDRQDGAATARVERPGDLIDLVGAGRSQVLDALAGALSLPVLTEPHPIAFSPESYWKGETHRTCDRPAAVERLLHELAVAGVEQVIVASASADCSEPHQLNRPSGTLEARVAEHLSAAEASAIRDAVANQSSQFEGMFLIRPGHNPVGPFDREGAFDARSDRFESLDELVKQGYDDAYRQFIEPVVGAGE
jgi:hypothetical protein